MGDNLDLSPQGSLEFHINGELSTTRLVVKNLMAKPVAFKVKTTQPSWYYVRPNQDMLKSGETLEIEIALVEAERKRAYALAKKGTPVDLSKHRFMVMSCTLEDQLVEELNLNDERLMKPEDLELVDKDNLALERKKCLSSLWDGTREDHHGKVKNTRMKVMYTIVDGNLPSEQDFDQSMNAAATAAVVAPVQSVSSRVEEMRKEFSTLTREIQVTDSPADFEECLKLFKVIKQKYTALEDYTMSQMGELDAVKAEVDKITTSLAKVNKEIKTAKEEGRAKAVAAAKPKATWATNKGFLDTMINMKLSLLFVGIAVVLAYLAGRRVPPLIGYHDLPLFLQRVQS